MEWLRSLWSTVQGLSIYGIFGVISLAVCLASLAVAFAYGRKRDKAKNILTEMHVALLGVFLAVFLLMLPVQYAGFDFAAIGAKKDSWIIRPFLAALLQAFRAFIFDGDFKEIMTAVAGEKTWIRIGFSLYTVALYVLAPILTLTNVLYLFRNLWDELRYRLCRFPKLYIFSELNERSVAMAHSIWEDASLGRKRIVFTDVFAQNEERHYDLQLSARDMRAICLKRDIAHLPVLNKRNPVEIFLMGDDESENVSRAMGLTKQYEEWLQLQRPGARRVQEKKLAVYVYAASVGAEYIIDSLERGEGILDLRFTDKLTEIDKEYAEKAETVENRDALQTLRLAREEELARLLNAYKGLNGRAAEEAPSIEGPFYLRHVNNVELLVASTLCNPHDHAVLAAEAARRDTVYITLVGMGDYGLQFLKTALWLYQLQGRMVEINVIDLGESHPDEFQRRLAKMCPEIRVNERCDEPGDVAYHLHFYGGVDCFTGAFEQLFSDHHNTHLRKTQLAVMALGDDERNIEAAVAIRRLFDRVHGHAPGGVDELPLIYAVVYDDKKAGQLTAQLKNHKQQSFNIRFIGSLSEQYSYKTICRMKEAEKAAFYYHVKWMLAEKRLRDAYRAAEAQSPFRQKVEQALQLRGETAEKWLENSFSAENILGDAQKYVRYQYFRRSSIAQLLHKPLVNHCFADCEANSISCDCSVCTARRVTEHMRWNMFMRTEGYSYSPVRNDRAQCHDDLVPWSELSFFEQLKD